MSSTVLKDPPMRGLREVSEVNRQWSRDVIVQRLEQKLSQYQQVAKMDAGSKVDSTALKK